MPSNAVINPPKLFIVASENNLLLKTTGDCRHLLTEDDLLHAHQFLGIDIEKYPTTYLGDRENFSVYMIQVHPEIQTQNDLFTLTPARPYFDKVDRQEHFFLFRLLHLVSWDQETQYCGKCGTQMFHAKDEMYAKVCENGHKKFVTYSHAIIVRIKKVDNDGQEKILLVRQPTYPPGRYSHVAGFIDAGEDFQQAVRREIKEEVNIEVDDIEYYGDQSWPFPNSSHMIAFTATYKSGEIKVDNEEIIDAKWFSIDEVAELISPPSKFSISYQMLRDFVNKKNFNS